MVSSLNLRQKKHPFQLKAILLGLIFLFFSGGPNSGLTYLPNAEAGFFSNDLELLEEVVDLVGD